MIYIVLILWLLPFILYICYPIIYVYISHKSDKTDNRHYTIGDIVKEANELFYNDILYYDIIGAMFIPIFNWCMVFIFLNEETHLFRNFKHILYNILSPIKYIWKGINIMFTKIKKIVYKIRII